MPMGKLITAIALAVSFVQPQIGAPSRRPADVRQVPQTLYTSPSGTIQAFAQDRQLIAWFTPSAKACNTVWVLSLASAALLRLPDQTSNARNVTCRWDVAPPVKLALAGPDALWTLRDRQTTLPFDYVLGAGANDPLERRFKEVAHAKRGAGLWLGGITGDSVMTGGQTVSTLAYGIAAVQYVDEIACLSGGSCEMKLAGGGVYRVAGRNDPALIPNTRPAVSVSVSASTLAYVPAAEPGPHGRPLPAADGPIEIVNVETGDSIAHVSPQGTPVAIALEPHVLVALERTAKGLKLAWYAPTTGASLGSVPVPAGTAPELSANDQLAVFRIGRFLHVLTLATGHSRTVAQTVGQPIGVSLEGNRLAWAENVRGRGRIRALYLKS
jgi:hypothetical protein